MVLEHFLTDTADHADYVLPATTQLEHWDVHTAYGHTYALLNEPAIEPVGQSRPNTAIFRALAARLGFTEACFARRRRDARARRLPQRGRRLRAPAAAGLGQAADARRAVRRRRLPHRQRQGASADAPGLGLPDHVPNYESAAVGAGAGGALSAGDDLAAGAQLPQLDLRQRGKACAPSKVEPLLEIHPADAAARGIADGATVRVFNDRGSYLCKAALNERARPGVVNGLGVWWRKLGLAGTNVNELTHQRLTDIGRAPTFYDCLVEVAPA